MEYYSELTSPTAVTHSLVLPFLSATANNLVVAKTSLLQIFSVKTIARDVMDSTPRSERLHVSKLVHVAEYSISGTITSLARVKIMNSRCGGEALLVSLKDAKVSLLEWDPERHAILTTSIHLYEREDLQGSPWAPDLADCQSYLTVDPSSRCAALKFGMRNLAILPFHQPGDDLVMDDYDPNFSGNDADVRSTSAKSSDVSDSETPYSPSFVLPMSALDQNLRHPIHLAFLYEYREPTFGILYASTFPSASLLPERKDTVSYAVFTLDIEQRASTMLLSVTGLPYDLNRVIPLPPPVGGSLLVGSNVIVHVDQAGRTNALGVNEFARECSSFSMADQSDLMMKLEQCMVDQLGTETGDMLLILSSGELAILSFKIDGRSVSGLLIHRISEDNGGSCLLAGASSMSVIGRGKLFIGSEDGDSTLLGWSNQSMQLKRRKSHGDQLGLEGESSTDEEMDDLDDSDLYSVTADATMDTRRKSWIDREVGDYKFRVFDTLPNFGPMEDVVMGKPYQSPDEKFPSNKPVAPIELLTASGRGRAGGVTIFQREITPHIVMDLDIHNVTGLWVVRPTKFKNKFLKQESTISNGHVLNPKNAETWNDSPFLITSNITETGAEVSSVYKCNASGVEELKDTEFEPEAGSTIDVGSLSGGTRIVQALKSEIRSYDADFGLAQIYPMTDELTGAEPKIVSTSFVDPFVLILRDDSSIIILQVDESGDLDEVERTDSVIDTKWISGCLYRDETGILSQDDKTGVEKNISVLACLLNTDGGLLIFKLPNFGDPIYVADGLGYMPSFLSTNYTPRRAQTRETIVELLIADLGDCIHKSPYLIARTAVDDLVLYEPYRLSKNGSGELRFLKVPNTHLAKEPEDGASDTKADKPLHMRILTDVDGYSAVFLPGPSPSFVLKSASTLPKVILLRGKAVEALSDFHSEKCQKGFVYVDVEGTVRLAQLPKDRLFCHSGLVANRVHIGERVNRLCYHSKTQCYVAGTSHGETWKLPEDDEIHYEWRNEDIGLLPVVPYGSLKVLNTRTWTCIQTYHLEPAEVILALSTLSLETSEITHTRDDLICVGTSYVTGEDINSRGRILIFSLVYLVPEPGQPETDRGLKLICEEDVKGNVTALSGVGTQGFLIVAMGQKILVRGLKEDGSLLPVAFLDVMTCATVLRELRGSGICLFADMWKGVWLIGYEEEPYRLKIFSKIGAGDKKGGGLEIVAGDLLPVGRNLHIVLADAQGNIHIYQFNPEDPKSLSGTRLLPVSTFHTAHFPSSLRLIPTTSPSSPYAILITSQTGVISLLTPLSEPLYRRLSALQGLLLNSLDHWAGLNPRAYRYVQNASVVGGGVGGKGIIDGNVVGRWNEVPSARKWDIAARVGGDIREDLRSVGADGVLGYL